MIVYNYEDNCFETRTRGPPEPVRSHLLVALLVWRDLYGHDGASGAVHGAEDLAEGALAEHLVELELRRAVLLHRLRLFDVVR